MRILPIILVPFLALPQIGSAEGPHRLKLTGGLLASSFAGPGGWAVGSGPSLGANYMISERFGVGAAFAQTFAASNGFTPFFSRFEIVLTAALTGSLISSESNLTVNEQPFFQSVTFPSEGFRGKVKANQYFFTGATSVYPYAGLGLELSYEWRGETGLGYEINCGMDFISNTVTTSIPLNVSFAVLLWP